MFKNYFLDKKAAFFDLDGTLIDSLPYWEEAHLAVYREVTGEPYIILPLVKSGSSTEEIWKYVLQNSEVKIDLSISKLVEKTNQAFLKIFRERPLEVRDGFWNLAYELKEEKGYRLALTTNTDRIVADPVLAALNLKETIFELTLAGDEVKHRKPAPDIYRKALKEMGLKSEEVIVFEDSLAGANSADAAGLEMIIIWNSETDYRLYPKSSLTFLPDFSSLPGNLDKDYYESAKDALKELEEQSNPL
jgi:putative hydrolase of the HAD superfamily